MITNLGQLMLYVNDVKASADFWYHKVGFEKVVRMDLPHATAYLVAPKMDSEVAIVLQDRQAVAKLSPELPLATPSLLMSCDDIEATHQAMSANGVAVNPIMQMGQMRVFNFADNEGNYFAITQA